MQIWNIYIAFYIPKHRELESRGNSMSDEKSGSDRKRKAMGSGVAVGIAIGVGIGVALGNIALGVGVGVAIGVAIGTARSKNIDSEE